MAANIFTNVACINCAGMDDDLPTVQRKKNLVLLTAAYTGHAHCADIFIKKGADVNCTDELFSGAFPSCLWGDCEPGPPLPDSGIDMSYGQTPLMYAAGNGHLGPVKTLIKAGADVNLVRNKITALLLAVSYGHYKCVEFLIDAGTNVNVTDPSVTPPLICAVRAGDTENNKKIIDLLIKAGADVNITFTDKNGTTSPLAEAAKLGSSPVQSKLIEAGADVNTKTSPA